MNGNPLFYNFPFAAGLGAAPVQLPPPPRLIPPDIPPWREILRPPPTLDPKEILIPPPVPEIKEILIPPVMPEFKEIYPRFPKLEKPAPLIAGPPIEWTSKAAELITQSPQKVWTAEQLKGFLAGKITKSEMEGMGIDLLTGKLSKDQILFYIERNMPQVEEVVKESKQYIQSKEELPKFIQYQLPGGENYREVLIKAPLGKITEPKYETSHWEGESNVLAHIRMNDRTTPDGKKILFIEEIQSDWARAGREFGFIDPKVKKTHDFLIDQISRVPKNSPEYLRLAEELKQLPDISNVPSHPLLKNWQELTLKRALKEAVEGNYDAISWTTGEQQAERYDLSKLYDGMQWDRNKDGSYNLLLENINKNDRVENIPADKLSSTIPKNLAEQILKDKNNFGEFNKAEIKVSPEWAKNLYDKQIPNILKDLTKGEVGSVNLERPLSMKEFSIRKSMAGTESAEIYDRRTGKVLDYFSSKKTYKENHDDALEHLLYLQKGLSQPVLKVTPQIKEKVRKGLPLFSALPLLERYV